MNRTKTKPTRAALLAVLLLTLAVPAAFLATGCGGGKPRHAADHLCIRRHMRCMRVPILSLRRVQCPVK